jgi:ATP-binding protein involved in chromosome partitioning
VVENMSYFLCPHCGQRTDIFGHGGARKMAEEHGVPLLGEIPLDPVIRAGGDVGRPVLLEEPESALAAVFREIAGRLAARLSVLSLSEQPPAASQQQKL